MKKTGKEKQRAKRHETGIKQKQNGRHKPNTSIVRVSVSVLDIPLKVGSVRLYPEQDLTIRVHRRHTLVSKIKIYIESKRKENYILCK